MFEIETKTKNISVTISENVLEETDKILKYYEKEGYKISRSSFMQSALKAYIPYINKKIEELHKRAEV